LAVHFQKSDLIINYLLYIDVVVNIVIPTMFEFIQISMDELKTLQTTVHDSMTSNAEYWAKLIAVLQVCFHNISRKQITTLASHEIIIRICVNSMQIGRNAHHNFANKSGVFCLVTS
jgi:hypothetical protein